MPLIRRIRIGVFAIPPKLVARLCIHSIRVWQLVVREFDHSGVFRQEAPAETTRSLNQIIRRLSKYERVRLAECGSRRYGTFALQAAVFLWRSEGNSHLRAADISIPVWRIHAILYHL